MRGAREHNEQCSSELLLWRLLLLLLLRLGRVGCCRQRELFGTCISTSTSTSGELRGSGLVGRQDRCGRGELFGCSDCHVRSRLLGARAGGHEKATERRVRGGRACRRTLLLQCSVNMCYDLKYSTIFDKEKAYSQKLTWILD